MFRMLWVASVYTSSILRHYMPTNILLDAIRTRHGLKWGVPAMLLAVPYLIAASACSAWIENGGPGWATLLVLLLIWNALKFIIMGPISLALFVRVSVAGRINRREFDHERNASGSASSFVSRH